MEKTTKEKTIDELLIQRTILVKQMCSWFCGYNAHINIPSQIREIDKLIRQLNGISES